MLGGIGGLSSQDGDGEKKMQDDLAFKLCQLYAIDQHIRNQVFLKDPDTRKAIAKIDSVNFTKFIDFVVEHGFPRKALVGEKNWKQQCVNNVGFVYLVHHPTKAAKEYYDFFKSEIEQGNLSPELLMYALDRHYVEIEKKSYFDSPYKVWTTGKGVCLQDRALSDSLRLDIGLPVLPDSAFVDCKDIDMNKALDFGTPFNLMIPQ